MHQSKEQSTNRMTGKEKLKKDVVRDCKFTQFTSPNCWGGQTVSYPEITSQSSSDMLIPVKDLILTASAISKYNSKQVNAVQSAQSLKDLESYGHKNMIKRSWSAAYLADKSKFNDQPAAGPNTNDGEFLNIPAGSGNLTTQQTTPGPYFKFWNSTLPARSSGYRRNKSKTLILRHLSEFYRSQLPETDQSILEQADGGLDPDQHAPAGVGGVKAWL